MSVEISATKLVSYAVLAADAAVASKLVSYAVLAPGTSYAVSVTESVSASDTVDATISGGGIIAASVAETLSASDTVDATASSGSLISVSVAESLTASDTVDATISGGGTAPTIVQTALYQFPLGVTGPANIPLTNPPTAGNVLIAAVPLDYVSEGYPVDAYWTLFLNQTDANNDAPMNWLYHRVGTDESADLPPFYDFGSGGSFSEYGGGVVWEISGSEANFSFIPNSYLFQYFTSSLTLPTFTAPASGSLALAFAWTKSTATPPPFTTIAIDGPWSSDGNVTPSPDAENLNNFSYLPATLVTAPDASLSYTVTYSGASPPLEAFVSAIVLASNSVPVLTISDPTPSSLTASWTGGTGGPPYTLLYRQTGTTLWTQIGGIEDTSQVVTGLTSLTQYDFQIAAKGYSFTNLGTLTDGAQTSTNGISPDGGTVVGNTQAYGVNVGYIWTAEAGMVSIGYLDATSPSSAAIGASNDGAIICGSSAGPGAEQNQPASWTASGGIVGLGYPGGAGSYAQAVAISSDGSTLVGYITYPDLHSQAFTWTEGGGFTILALQSGGTFGFATGCSANGSVVCGYGNNTAAPETQEAWIWTVAGGFVSLGFLAGGNTSQALGISPDWSIVVGTSNATGGNNHAFKWTSATGMVDLGYLSTGADKGAQALGCSADGSFVVGSDGAQNLGQGHIQGWTWTEATGMVGIGYPSGYTISQVTACSADGTVLAVNGYGATPNDEAAFIAGLSFSSTAIGTTTGIPTINATMADLWFSPTPGFVDLTVPSNRRNFISDNGGAQNLGADGSAPFGVTPPVFLSSDGGSAATFADNDGRGGAFTLSGTLAFGTTNPPGSSQSVTTAQANSPGQGVLGDFRNGNLYAFNPRTLTDNGTPRRWLRRWRALPAASAAAKRFFTLAVTMQSGAGVPDGVTPSLVLRWSDDGGATWSDERIVTAGNLGATVQPIKFNRLGASRRFGGSDRIFELSSSDPFMTAILDADIDVG